MLKYESANIGLVPVLRHLQNLATRTGPDSYDIILAVLLELSVPSNSLGFAYLHAALTLFCKNPGAALYGGIYAQLIEKDPLLSAEQIEQAIRRAVKKAWKNKDSVLWKYYFSPPDNGILEIPTSQAFISRVGYILYLFFRRR